MKLASRIFQSIEKEFQLRESSCPCCRVNVRARALGLGGGLEFAGLGRWKVLPRLVST